MAIMANSEKTIWRLTDQLERARRTAVELEQRNSEALRLLGVRTGLHNDCTCAPCRAARVLRGDDDG